jgi:hypothetical protein
MREEREESHSQRATPTAVHTHPLLHPTVGSRDRATAATPARSCSARRSRQQGEDGRTRGGHVPVRCRSRPASMPWCRGRRQAKKRERKRARRRPPKADPAAWWPDLTLPAAPRRGEEEHNVGWRETATGAWGRRRVETDSLGWRRVETDSLGWRRAETERCGREGEE